MPIVVAFVIVIIVIWYHNVNKIFSSYTPDIIIRFFLSIGPNDAVLDQWDETLIKSGVDFNRIKNYRYSDDEVLAQADHFFLMTRYTMMSEMRNLLETKFSNLMPDLSKHLLGQLGNVYKSGQGKVSSKVRRKGETGSECITRLMRNNIQKIAPKPLFRTFLLDEAHFLKNLESYWGLFGSLLGAVSDKLNLYYYLPPTIFHNANADIFFLTSWSI